MAQGELGKIWIAEAIAESGLQARQFDLRALHHGPRGRDPRRPEPMGTATSGGAALSNPPPVFEKDSRPASIIARSRESGEPLRALNAPGGRCGPSVPPRASATTPKGAYPPRSRRKSLRPVR